MNGMIRHAAIVLAVAAMAAPLGALHAADEIKLESKAKITLEFPDLPETFYAEATKQQVPARLTAELPENYSREGRFPVFVFLGGGNGGRGADTTARSIVGPRDFIAVNMPLFKDHSASNPPLLQGIDLRAVGVSTSRLIFPSDAAKLSQAYRVMLQKLFDTVPNIAVERSTFGGFSNGAHATAALLAVKDEMLLRHFRAFYLVEGGLALLANPTALEEPVLRQCRFIMLFGDHDSDAMLQAARTLIAEPLLGALAQKAATQRIELTRITMRGIGHAFPAEYKKLLGCWVREEELPEIK